MEGRTEVLETLSRLKITLKIFIVLIGAIIGLHRQQWSIRRTRREMWQPVCSSREEIVWLICRKCSDYEIDDAQNEGPEVFQSKCLVRRGWEGELVAKPQNQKNLRNCQVERNGDKTCHIIRL